MVPLKSENFVLSMAYSLPYVVPEAYEDIEKIAEKFPGINITSGLRSEDFQKTLPTGAEGSKHLTGRAIDIGLDERGWELYNFLFDENEQITKEGAKWLEGMNIDFVYVHSSIEGGEKDHIHFEW